MGVDDHYRALLTELSTAREQLRRREPLSNGGGGGTSGGMEDLVMRLERQHEQLGKDVADLRVAVATLTERVAHLPGKGFIVTATSATIALIGSIVLFADKLRMVVGH